MLYLFKYIIYLDLSQTDSAQVKLDIIDNSESFGMYTNNNYFVINCKQ